ncbi:hypothetical protein AGLY_015474 [Aphis glycines]|uniref:Reverse transcriptase domain-containing protein n=1 Tax=Aphis glycines TaxID=307491 RepID=A0A6G0T0L1_APHGL|nr:hypothetical protein AGLY_015474 [Aphis glycines]
MAVRRETGISVGSFAPVRPGIIPGGDPAIRRIESKKAAGLDGITSGILKQAWAVLAEPITHAFNCALRSRIFPSTCKDAALVIIRKGSGKDPTETKSYRPISFLPVLVKALEGMYNRDENPSGYGLVNVGKADRSTVDAIDRVLEWTVERTEKYVLGIFLGITGAFDFLWLPRLFKNLQSNGCCNGLIEFTRSYLDGRRAHISVGGELMSRTLTKGCPQGS